MKTLPHLLATLSKTAKGQTALIDRGTILNYSELRDKSHQLAAGLTECGIRKGDRVGLWLPNIAAYLEIFFACAQIGAIAVSVNTKFKSHEMADIVARSGCKMLVLWPEFKNIPFFKILSEVPSDGLTALKSVVLYGEGEAGPTFLPQCLTGKDVHKFSDLYRQEVFLPEKITESDGAVIFTTSGTTGKPKFVVHSQRSLTQHAIEVAQGFGYAARPCRMLQAIPLCGTFGLTQALAGLAAKAEVHCLSVFDPETAAQLIQDHKITDMNGSDDMFAALLDQSTAEQPFPSLRQAGFAAFNPSLTDIVERAESRGIKLMGLWGMSEVQALVSHQDTGATIETRKQAGGRLISPSAKIRVVDPETDKILPLGEQGEIQIKTPSQMTEYFGNPEATQKALTDDGFIRTGDLGIQQDQTRFLFLTRMGDVLRLGGYLTDPVEIEACLQEHPGVSQAQVVGVTTKTGAKAFAYVVMAPDVTMVQQDILDFCKANLAGYKRPIAVVAIKTFPMTESANGLKIQRSKLRDDAAKFVIEQAL